MQIVLQFVYVAYFDFQWFPRAPDLAHNRCHAVYFSDPSIDVGLVLVDIVFDQGDLLDDFTGILRHDLYFPHEVALLFHVQLLQSKDQFVFILEQLFGSVCQIARDFDKLRQHIINYMHSYQYLK